ncbi:ABC transporter substrate-binding protein [Candidatus Peregrinibacteria bacterium]|nr:ABC transporter substrate-binding protein [Candidatus Peregrinibacteria bacterium]
MRRILQLLSAMTRWEKLVLTFLIVVLLSSSAGLVRLFYLKNSTLVSAEGGTYIEGTVGELLPLNPWFIVRNDVNRDIVSLVFAGLRRYNTLTREIENDLATMEVSRDSKIYTVRLKDNIYWHDSTEERPHLVTADDILFTFKTIQDPQFPNELLRQNFRGVRIDKVDDRTVRFTLDKPYSYFPSNLTLGLLPQVSFDGIPASNLDQASDFGFSPVGAGPYRVKSVVRTDMSTEVTLERFPRAIPPVHKLDGIVFRIFADYSSLLLDLRHLDGVRLVPRNDDGQPIIAKRFTTLKYTLPQYVALFFNLDRPALQDVKLRIGLQQGTDKRAIADAIHESLIIDTPLLELDAGDWHYKFDSDAAQGALLASRWNLPERVRLQRVLELEDANDAGLIHPPPVVLFEEGGSLTITGAYVPALRLASVNGVALRPGPAGSGSWMVQMPFLSGTGALFYGDNLVKVTDGKKRILDSFYVFVAKDHSEFDRAYGERRLARLYRATKDGSQEGDQKISIGDLALDAGMLRMRNKADPASVRVNEKGASLELRLLTSDAPESYRIVANEIARQWLSLGARVKVEVASSPQEFQDRLLRRDYDILLFGQSLLDNLDSYPYWHSSSIQKLTGQNKDLRQDAYNLSQYVSFKADAELETIRRTTDEKERQASLSHLREILKTDAPAIFLYSPQYIFAHNKDIFGIELGSLSLHSDRFLTLHKWYVKRERVFKPGVSWGSFFRWLPSLLQ